ncbi:YihY/virulence factor BrkB family protein [Candidatus Mycoplasma mahonii]|uniref:YihY/virulence factor BrkB family protein n=1 Tax=Candidatus Mycoplasma mahonii TaxID=3004105 RepID=UPI0026E99D2D|nr:YihY/virulence factor BrkB family protein [Candidatus Mycoplasma mahonii]WKX02527.1 YihY/virulence factor BrkB family protein [Candidatus Mycoplasma mahonii]
MFKKNKPRAGYQTKPEKKAKVKKNRAMHDLLVSTKTNKIFWTERLVKFLIYISLRIVIRPKKWKYPKKNIEIINRTYRRIMSNDFVYIPSSIAFYLIMAFMPILSLIVIFNMIPEADAFFISLSTDGKKNAIAEILSKFIPGASTIFNQIKEAVGNKNITTSASILTILSILISTWIASNGFSKLIYTQSYIYEHKYLGGYWMNKFKGMFLVIVFTLFLFFILSVNVLFTKWLSTFEIEDILKEALLYIYLSFGMFIGFFVGFILLYKFSPRFKIKIKHVVPGAMVSTLPTTGFLILFGFISSLWSYDSYGVIGAIMYIGMSSLIVTYFIFVGISANAAYYKTFVNDGLKNKWTISKK